MTFLLMNLLTYTVTAQHSDDVYYSPGKPLEPDTSKSSVRKFGIYFSNGFGVSGIRSLPDNVSDLTILGLIVSNTFAYKSHLATITFTAGSSTFTGATERESYFSNSYLAFLIGESLRFKYSLISLSVGVASSEMSYRNVIDMHHSDSYNNKGVSFPVELKLFILAKHGIGFGVHLYNNFDKDYSTSFISAVIVAGIWNK